MLKTSSASSFHYWLSEPVSHEVRTSLERLVSAESVRHVAVMPDVHLANEVCVGAVAATSELIYPAAVGSDIGCGMTAVRFHGHADSLCSDESAARVMSGLYRFVPAIRQGKATAVGALPEHLQSTSLSHTRLDRLRERDGRVQFGTLGRGNHFLEFQADEANQLWLLVHSGSRSMGQSITKHHLKHVEGQSNGLAFVVAKSAAGKAYLHDVEWALRYAAENRLAMATAAAAILRDLFRIEPDWDSVIQSHHNHVQLETHFGQKLWVHRKGAQSACPGEVGIIPGSMGTVSFHVAGRGCPDSLRSSSHGAGRTMSRGEARRRTTISQLEKQMGTVWYDHRCSRVLLDVAPAAYKDIRVVMRSQRVLVRIVRELRPILNFKAV